MNQQRQFQHQLTGSAAELYERYVVPYLFAAWAQELVEQMDLRPGERVLDVACGTGIVARNAAEKVGTSGTVTGLDINPGMLAVAGNLRLPAGTPSIQWVECSALDMQLEDASFDVVLCEQGFQFFPDKSVALKEMRRVLVPRGRLAISVWFGPSPYNIAMANGIERHLNQSQGGICIETGLASAANTVIPANAGIQGTAQNVLSWIPAYAGVTKDLAPSGRATTALPIAEAHSGV